MAVETIHLALRTTARASFVLFLAAFSGPGLGFLWRSGVSDFLARQRERFLLLFAASHTVHLACVIALASVMGWTTFLAKFTWVTVIIGGAVFGLIYCLAVDAALRLGGRARSLLSAGFANFAWYTIWIVFALAYVPRMGRSAFYTLAGLAALAGLVVRVAGRQRKAAARSATAA